MVGVREDSMSLSFDFEAHISSEERKVFTVSEITRSVKNLLESAFDEEVWVRGEVSNYRGPHPSGHSYFKLRDKDAVINAVVFKSSASSIKFDIKDGAEVLARGRLKVYMPAGSYQLVIEYMEPAGRGDLYRKFEELKEKLRKRGWFDEEVKKAIPCPAYRIGVVTSPAGAVLRDIVKTVHRRFPRVDIVVFPCRVQGDGAAQEIAAALRAAADHSPAVDVVILARGGGSIEDLWAFNEEDVAVAIHDSNVPVVSAVGHQTDFTIADFTADARAATPTAAAELVTPDEKALVLELKQKLGRAYARAESAAAAMRSALFALVDRPVMADPMTLLEPYMQSLDGLSASAYSAVEDRLRKAGDLLGDMERRVLLKNPLAHWRRAASEFRLLGGRLSAAVESRASYYASELSSLSGALDALSPLAVLGRGYSITTGSDGKVLKSARVVDIGDRVNVRLSEGRLGCRVESKEEG